MYVRIKGHDNEGGGSSDGIGGDGNNLSREGLNGRDIANATLPEMALTCCLILVTLVVIRVCRQRRAVIECTDNCAT